jgi:hypothetical protein
MTASRFATWTRRRLGWPLGGLGVSLLGLAHDDGARAKKHHKKRCKKLHNACTPGGRKCCHGNLCESFDAGSKGSFFCCKGTDKTCSKDEECCPGFHCDDIHDTCQPICPPRTAGGVGADLCP